MCNRVNHGLNVDHATFCTFIRFIRCHHNRLNFNSTIQLGWLRCSLNSHLELYHYDRFLGSIQYRFNRFNPLILVQVVINVVNWNTF